MDTTLSNWNGYDIHGDIKELDSIVESTGFINLDKNDVIGVLSADGENWVTTGIGIRIDEAFTKAYNKLSFPIDKITNLLISFRFGNRQPSMAEISNISSVLSNADHETNVRWGIAKDETLGDSFKAILIASVDR